jgi:hypothetical protein
MIIVYEYHSLGVGNLVLWKENVIRNFLNHPDNHA